MRGALPMVFVLAACGGAPPTAREPATVERRPIVRKRVRADEIVQPVEVDDRDVPRRTYADEPVVACEDRAGRLRLAPPPPDWDDVETRGRVVVGDPIYREGCIEPYILDRELEDLNGSLVECFHDAGAGELSLRVRARFEQRHGGARPQVRVELLFPPPDEYEYEYRRDTPTVDEAGLRGCLERALGSIRYLGHEPRLPAVVDLPIERSVSREGGVEGGVGGVEGGLGGRNIGGVESAPPPPPPPPPRK